MNVPSLIWPAELSPGGVGEFLIFEIGKLNLANLRDESAKIISQNRGLRNKMLTTGIWY